MEEIINIEEASETDDETTSDLQISTQFKKRDLYLAVIEATDVKKSDVRAVVDATLVALRSAMNDELDLQLPPIGKFKMTKAREQENGKTLQYRVKISDPEVAEEVDLNDKIVSIAKSSK